MDRKIVAVAGGAGVVGRLLADELHRRGHVVRVLSPSRGVDLVTGRGMAEALEGVTAIVDVANLNSASAPKSRAFFSAVASNLVDVGWCVGVRHYVALSIVGSDRIDFGHYLGRREKEWVVVNSGLPWTVLRATQFFEFPQALARGRSPVVVVPRMRSRLVAARDVAEQLATIALGEPARAVIEMCGPETHEMLDLTKRWLRSIGSQRAVVPIQLPGRLGRAMARGDLIPATPAIRGTTTWDDWLGHEVGARV